MLVGLNLILNGLLIIIIIITSMLVFAETGCLQLKVGEPNTEEFDELRD